MSLIKIKSKNNDILNVKKFIKKYLFTSFCNSKKKLVNSVTQKEFKKKMNLNDLIISPSDFGFHNIIKKKKNLL